MRLSTLLLVSLFCPESHGCVPGTPDPRCYSGEVPAHGAPPPPPQCPPTGLQYFSDLSRCDAYYKCTDGLRSYHECSWGMLYNPNTASDSYPCDDAVNVNCDQLAPFTPSSPTPVCPDEKERHLPDPDNCSAFYECREGVAFPRMCPKELFYNHLSPATRFPCDYPANVDCGPSPTPLLPPPSELFPPQLPQDRDSDKPKKVFNFYTYVTINW